LKVTPLCASALIQRRALELETLEELSTAEKLSALRSIVESMLIYIGPDIEYVEVASVSYRIARKVAPVEKLYESLIPKALSVSEQRAGSIRDSLEDKPVDEAIPLLMRAAALATGYRLLDEPYRVLEEPPGYMDLVNARVGRDDSKVILDALRDIGSRGGMVYYVFGGSAELPYDMALIERMRDELGVEVVGVVRSGRFEDSATLGDLEKVGLASRLDDIITVSGGDALFYGDEGQHVLRLLESADLVFMKGELAAAFVHNSKLEARVALLFTAACPSIASAYGVGRGTVNILLLEAGGGLG